MALAAHELAGRIEPAPRRRVVAPGWGQAPPETVGPPAVAHDSGQAVAPRPPGAPVSVRGSASMPQRRRRTVGVAVLVAVAALAVVVGRPGSSTVSADRARPVQVVVGPGQTLWEVAGPYAPDGVQPHVWARRVARTNKLDPRVVRPGTALTLPAP